MKEEAMEILNDYTIGQTYSLRKENTIRMDINKKRTAT